MHALVIIDRDSWVFCTIFLKLVGSFMNKFHVPFRSCGCLLDIYAKYLGINLDDAFPLLLQTFAYSLFISFCLQAITSSGTKKGDLFLADVNTQLKNKNITTDIKVDTSSNVTYFSFTFCFIVFLCLRFEYHTCPPPVLPLSPLLIAWNFNLIVFFFFFFFFPH